MIKGFGIATTSYNLRVVLPFKARRRKCCSRKSAAIREPHAYRQDSHSRYFLPSGSASSFKGSGRDVRAKKYPEALHQPADVRSLKVSSLYWKASSRKDKYIPARCMHGGKGSNEERLCTRCLALTQRVPVLDTLPSVSRLTIPKKEIGCSGLRNSREPAPYLPPTPHDMFLSRHGHTLRLNSTGRRRVNVCDTSRRFSSAT